MFLSTLLGLFPKFILQDIAGQLADAYRSKLAAQNDETRIEAEIAIKRLEAHQAIILQEQRHWMTRWIRPAFALPFIIYNGKIILWDKVLGLGSTDNLSSEYWQLQMVIFGAYFLTRPFETSKLKW